MAIKNEDLIINKSERMTQFDDGGGKITGHVLQNNKSNEVFSDVTAIDRVAGKLEYAKLYAAVKTYGDPMTDENGQPINGVDGAPIIVPETLQAAGVIITKNPSDPNIRPLLFSTRSHYDEVSDIKSRVESYMSKTVRISGELVGRQPAGAKMIRLAQQLGAQPPKAGETICIIQDEGKSNQIEEYLKIEKVESNQQTVNVQVGADIRPMMMNMINISLYYPLQNTFDGGEVTGNDSATKRTILRSAQVSDATSYKGAQNLTEATSIGDLRVRVQSVFGQLAPPSEGQANIVDMQAGTDSSPVVASGGSSSFTAPQNFTPGSVLFCGIGILPGTLKINYPGGTLEDVGGQLMNGETPVATINYGRGMVTFSMSSPTFTGNKTVVFNVATVPPRAISQTEAIQITESNRSDTYNINLFPAPEPGGTTVDFVAMGSRYRLRDRGDGILTSDGAGVGVVDYKTGSVSITLTAAPDVNTAIIFSFSNKVDYMSRGNLTGEQYRPKFTMKIGDGQLTPGGLKLSWVDGETTNTITDNNEGVISGKGLVGTINYITGDLEFYFSTVKTRGTKVVAEYVEAGTDNTKTESLTGMTGANQRIQLPDSNLRPRSVRIEFNVQSSRNNPRDIPGDLLSAIVIVYDDGLGKLKTTTGGNAGTIDYATGVVNLITGQNVEYWVPVYGFRDTMSVNGGKSTSRYIIEKHQRENRYSTPPTDGGSFIDVKYATSGDNATKSQEMVVDVMTATLSPNNQEYIVPGSVSFSFSGRKFYDVDGAIYADMDINTGSGSFSGIINYQNGEISLTNWGTGSSNIVIHSLLTMLNYLPVSGIDFIIPTAPIRAGSLLIRATRIDGVRLEAWANENGEFTAQSMRGKVDNSTGVTSLEFGQWVPIAGNENEDWFDVRNIDGTNVWMPYLVMIETIKYNVVSTTFSPVDPEVLGISLVRLPIDGRVPIYKNGDLVVLHETHEQIMPIDAPIDHVMRFGVELVADLWVEDADEKRVDCTKFEFNKITGEIKIIDNDFSGYKMPLKGCALVEEENSITDVQITGLVALRKPIKHRFTTKALLSGLMYIGDMQARYTALFEQSTWQTNQWSDIPNGQPNWRFNDTEYPLKLTNADTVHERWALLFTSPTNFSIYGENLGLIGVGSTASDCAPINPNTKAPYFTLSFEGWGNGGISAGNVLRFNTISATQPFWLTRSVVPSDDTGRGDSFSWRFRGFKSGD